jgi:hypothetical protein
MIKLENSSSKPQPHYVLFHSPKDKYGTKIKTSAFACELFLFGAFDILTQVLPTGSAFPDISSGLLLLSSLIQ